MSENKKQQKKVEKPKPFVNPTIMNFGKITRQDVNSYSQGIKTKKNKIFRGVK